MSTEPKTAPYTAFCTDASDPGSTIWIDCVHVPLPFDVAAATAIAREACAFAWSYEDRIKDIHVLGFAEGDIRIVHWQDLS